MNSRDIELLQKLIASRTPKAADIRIPRAKDAEEGGCGVVGFATTVPVRGRHIFEPSIQMHNRGNGKGGGIACAAFDPDQLGVDEKTLREDYILQIALLDETAEAEVEKQFIEPRLRVDHKRRVEPAADWKELGMPIAPPQVVRYHVRVKEDVLSKFAEEHGLKELSPRELEDELIFQNSAALNRAFYASLGDKRAFVLSHSRDLMIFKVVGYAEHVVQYYGLEDMTARVWIAHQRYPTKGRVWHPAGSHPFIGMNEALVHNGDFANYFSVSEYLRQHNIEPQFLTDTEVSVLLFDLWRRSYGYPLEYVIEAMAPTTELDFDRLPVEKQRVYRAIQALHMHGSPDGPWFFIIARSTPEAQRWRLLGITDTSMLRPQVFAIQEGDVSIGLVASEKQAIDATLRSLHQEDGRFRLVADRYWNARGGSHTDGGAFSFTVERHNGSYKLACADKFGKPITAPGGLYKLDQTKSPEKPDQADRILNAAGPEEAWEEIRQAAAAWTFENLRWVTDRLAEAGDYDNRFEFSLRTLTLMNDRRCDWGDMRPSMVLQVVRSAINRLLDSAPPISSGAPGKYKRVDWESRKELRAPKPPENTLVVCARDFPPEGHQCDARLEVEAHRMGWRGFIVYGLKGQRFHGCGLGPETQGVTMDIYDSSGDYLASGIDGLEMHVHGNGQDQLCQIMKSGRVVIYGDVGQAFLYGGKGGEIYVMGNAAGRPLINAVGRPRVVINGTCLDYLAESFMAGDPMKGGGFVILNGMTFDDRGNLVEQETPYPGSNLFSLASGGAIYVRDPHGKLVDDQLNGGEFAELTERDWKLILPCLERNEGYFGIKIEDLLTVNGEVNPPEKVYRKVRAVKLEILAGMEVPE